MRGSGEENNNGSGCGDKNRMWALDGKQEIYLEWPYGTTTEDCNYFSLMHPLFLCSCELS